MRKAKPQLFGPDSADFSAIASEEFLLRFRPLDQFSDPTSGYSGTLFRDLHTNQLVMAQRGTDDSLDLVADYQLAVGRKPFDQLVPMANYLLRLAGPAGQPVRQVELGKFDIPRWADTTATGLGLIGPDEIYQVVGHSLGGYLTALTGYAFGLRTGELWAYNNPGTIGFVGGVPLKPSDWFIDVVAVGLDMLRLQHLSMLTQGVSGRLPGPDRFVEVQGDWNVTLVPGNTGAVVDLRLEGSSHSQKKVVDALALSALMQKLMGVDSVEVGVVNSLLDSARIFGPSRDEAVLDGLRRTVLGPGALPSKTGIDSDIDASRALYQRHTLEFQASAAFAQLQGKVALQVADSNLAARLVDDFAALVAVAQLSPLRLVAQGSAAGELEGHLRAAHPDLHAFWGRLATTHGQGLGADLPYSTRWLADRAAMLGAIARGGQGGTRATGVIRDPSMPTSILYLDAALGISIDHVGAMSATRQAVHFGGDADERVEGWARDDALYGAAGADTLVGQQGDDHLEGQDGADSLQGGDGQDTLLGGSGNDTLEAGGGSDLLLGGTGHDTYRFDAGFGPGSVFDSDGQGLVSVAGTVLRGGRRRPGAEDTWASDDGRFTYARVEAGPSRFDLVVAVRGQADAAQPTGTLTIRNWLPGALGITLGSDAPAPAPGLNPLAGDYAKKLRADGVTYEFADGNYASAGALPNAQDLLFGFAGADRIAGGGGNDGLAGNAGNDDLDGGDGDDVLLGGSGSDTLTGGNGNDFIFGSGSYSGFAAPLRTTTPPPVAEGTELARGFGWVAFRPTGTDASGQRTYQVTLLRNQMAADGASFIAAGAGDDMVGTGTGHDLADGGAGNDVISGMGGADTLRGAAGADTLEGDGTTLDAYLTHAAAAEHGDDLLDGGPGADELIGQGGHDHLLGGEGDDRLLGDDRATEAGHVGAARHGRDVLEGGDGNDTLSGGGADDSLDGGTGNDRLWGDDTTRQVDGAFHGRDTLRGGDGHDAISGAGGADLIDGGAGNDTLEGDADPALVEAAWHGNDTIDGGTGDDRLMAGGGNDFAHGGDGRDVLFGQDGDDTLAGQAGDDELQGGAGGDVLVGGAGVDALDGGAGDDTYLFGPGDLRPGADGLTELVQDEGGNDTVVFHGRRLDDVAHVADALGSLVLQFRDGERLALANGAAGAIERIVFGEPGDAPTGLDALFGGFAQVLSARRDSDDRLVVNGGRGNDTVEVVESRARFSGGRGDDVFRVAGSGNVYRMQPGDGRDTIAETAPAGAAAAPPGTSRLQLGTGFSPQGITVSASGSTLVLHLSRAGAPSGDAVRIEGFDRTRPDAAPAIDTLAFADGTTLAMATLLARGFDHAGTPVAERVDGTAGVDRFAASIGDDTLAGGDGSDTYAWASIAGRDRIEDNGLRTADIDVLDLSAFHSPQDLSFVRSGLDLSVRLRGSTQGLTVAGQFAGDAQGVEQIRFEGDVAWGRAELAANLAQVFTGGADGVTGTEGNDVIAAGDGADQVDGAGGADHIDGEAGNDVLRGGHGNDTLVGGAGADTLNGGHGDDTLIDGSLTDHLWGDTGNDVLQGGVSMAGGDGSDTYTVPGAPPRAQTVWIDEALGAAPDGDVLHLPHTPPTGQRLFVRGFNAVTGGHDDLDIFLNGSDGGAIRLLRYFHDDPLRAAVEHIRMADGTLLDKAAVLQIIGGTTATAGNDSIQGYRFDERFDGGAGDDNVSGAGGNDTLAGGPGSDAVNGGTGHDDIDGGAGNDRLEGGTGADRYRFGRDAGNDMVVEAGGTLAETDTLALGAGIAAGDVTLHQDGLTLVVAVAGAGQVRVQRHFAIRDVNGRVVDHAIERIEFADGTVWQAAEMAARTVAGAQDTLTGGAGDDLHLVDHAADVVREAAGGGIDTVHTHVGWQLPEHVEHGRIVGVINARLVGNAGNNHLAGNAGANTLNGGPFDRWNQFPGWGWQAGADTLEGGAGDDTYWINGTAVSGSSYWNPYTDDTVIEHAGGGIDLVVSNTFHATLPEHVEHLADEYHSGTWRSNGTPLARRLVGNGLNNRIDASAPTHVVLNNSAGSVEQWNVGGAIVLDGGAGADTLIGGHEDTTYVVDDAGDVLIETGASTADTVTSSVALTLADGFENLVLTGTQPIDGTGNAAANRLEGRGNAAANRLAGGTGDDTYLPGPGDSVVEAADGGFDTVVITQAPVAGQRIRVADWAHVEAVTIESSAGTGLILEGTAGNDRLRNLGSTTSWDTGPAGGTTLGAAGDDSLEGGTGPDTLDGGTGNDTMAGGTGHDLYRVDSAGDVVLEWDDPRWFVDTVQTSIDYTLPAQVEAVQSLGPVGLRLTGRDAHDHLAGHTGAGADTLAGGAGNDRYEIGAGDTVAEAADGGHDIVIGHVGFTLPAHAEEGWLADAAGAANLAGQAGADVLQGNRSRNRLSGLDGNDRLLGAGGNDRLDGGNGNDTLDGGDGADQLTGGRGDDHLLGGEGDDIHDGGAGADHLADSSATSNDVYRWGTGRGSDTISDAGGTDRIELAAGITRAQVTLSRQGDSLAVGLAGSADVLMLSQWYATPAQRIETLRLADLTTIDLLRSAPGAAPAAGPASTDATRWDRGSAALLQAMAQFAAERDAGAAAWAVPPERALTVPVLAAAV